MLYKILRVAVPAFIFAWIFFSLPLVAGHGHSHDHEEPPAFKYSKEANAAHQNDDHDHHHHSNKEHEAPRKSSDMWFEAISATVIISVAPYLILFFIPVTNSVEHQPYLKVLLAFASGGLLGDAFLHLIPHALMAQEANQPHSHSHSHSHSPDGGEGGHSHDLTIGVSVLAGIITFLVVEKFVRIFKDGHGHSHAPAKASKLEDKNNARSSKKGSKEAKEIDPNEGKVLEPYCTVFLNMCVIFPLLTQPKIPVVIYALNESSTGSDIKVAGYLNLAADFTHNLTDGLAIGASFLAGRPVGIVTTLTIFLHEIPHEIGDFAILLQSGCTKRKVTI